MINKIKDRYINIMNNKKSGFSVIGLIITIAIIIMLGVAVGPNYKDYMNLASPRISGKKIPVESFVNEINKGNKKLSGLLDTVNP